MLLVALKDSFNKRVALVFEDIPAFGRILLRQLLFTLGPSELRPPFTGA
jgi:hypothetical protein|tara:strand:- start:132 stop:278 length:147 start_codon:yes stop_codon:yes gene_type:complete